MNIEEIKNQLLKEKEELELLLENQERETKEILSEQETATDILADIYEYKQEAHLTKEALEERIRAINKALDKINNGTYGICENCGKLIEEPRLKIDPTIYLCRECSIKKNF